ncbi:MULTISPECIES: hypothetical protein [unclassified Synechococcus]|uniref:hypothetical protein n=1 Tax=unclassified Synechococcus TaxID=2626047 RepID=UPI0021A4FD03|nr:MULTISPECIES: hypothetical protein [unclassified Synechococcus]MCT0232583.1 hypothetical protein [Synechococcus sp. CS-1327]
MGLTLKISGGQELKGSSHSFCPGRWILMLDIHWKIDGRILRLSLEVIHQCHALNEPLHVLVIDLIQILMHAEIFMPCWQMISPKGSVVWFSENK